MDDERLVGVAPKSMTEVDDSWWQTLLNGRLYMIDLDTFPVPVNSTHLRAFCHRRADTFGVKVMVHSPYRSRRFYVQAYPTSYTKLGVKINMSPYEMAIPAPAIPLVYQIRVDVTLDPALPVPVHPHRTRDSAAAFNEDLKFRQAMATAAEELRARDAAEKAEKDAYIAERKAEAERLNARARELKEQQGSEPQRQELTPEEEAEIDAWLTGSCDCGTDDKRFHPPHCRVYG